MARCSAGRDTGQDFSTIRKQLHPVRQNLETAAGVGGDLVAARHDGVRHHAFAVDGLWCFGQLARDYKRLFGETPSATMQRARRGCRGRQ